MPRGAIYKSRTVRRMSEELIDSVMAEIFATTPEIQAKLAAGITFDESAMRVFYTVGDHAVRAMLRLEEEQQQQQQPA